MADANPIVAALIDELLGFLVRGDVEAVQRNIDIIRAEIEENDALYAVAAHRLVGAAFRTEARHASPEPEGPLDDPEVAAHAATYADAAARVERIRWDDLLLVQVLACLVVCRAFAFAFNRIHLLPGVLLTAAAAYALAYVASCGAVVPGLTTLMWISVLVLCFLLGLPLVGNLP